MALLLWGVLAQAHYTPEEAQGLLAEAHAAFGREDWRAAEAGYQKLVEHGYGGPDVLYDLGTARLARGELGPAVLAFEQAKAQGGSGEDLEANLALARARQLDQVVGAAADEDFLPRLVRATAGNAAAWVFLVSWVAGVAALALLLRARGRARLALGAVLGILLTAALPSGALLAAHVWVARTYHEAVVLAPTLRARELPDDGARVAFEVHEGLKVRVLDADGRYVRLRLPNGLEGWAERAGVGDI